MEQAPKNPKLRNLPIPHPAIRCFLCGKPLVSDKGDLADESHAVMTGGIVILSCVEHTELAHVLLEEIRNFIKTAIQQAKEQQSKIE